MTSICPQCYFGRLEETDVSYFTLQEIGPVVLPKMPALSCRSCGYTEIDMHAEQNLLRLLRAPLPSAEAPTRGTRPVQLSPDQGKAGTQI